MNTLELTKEAQLEEALKGPMLICFVCTGNTCRSPMAAALLNDREAMPPICSMCDIERLLGKRQLRATSAGLYATGAPISKNAVAALERAGVRSLEGNDYAAHISRNIDRALMEKCDRIIGMTGAHAMSLMSAFPEFATKISCMPKDIPDPYGGDEEAYEACLAAIEEGLEALFFSGDEA